MEELVSPTCVPFHDAKRPRTSVLDNAPCRGRFHEPPFLVSGKDTPRLSPRGILGITCTKGIATGPTSRASVDLARSSVPASLLRPVFYRKRTNPANPFANVSDLLPSTPRRCTPYIHRRRINARCNGRKPRRRFSRSLPSMLREIKQSAYRKFVSREKLILSHEAVRW